jgi:hypothetical protein
VDGLPWYGRQQIYKKDVNLLGEEVGGKKLLKVKTVGER